MADTSAGVAEEANSSNRDHGVLGALGEHKTKTSAILTPIEFSQNQLSSSSFSGLDSNSA